MKTYTVMIIGESGKYETVASGVWVQTKAEE